MSETPDQVREWFQTALRKLWPVATGSLSLRQSPCVRTSCPACERGDGHASYALYGTDLLPGSISRCRNFHLRASMQAEVNRITQIRTDARNSQPVSSPEKRLVPPIRSAPFRECGS